MPLDEEKSDRDFLHRPVLLREVVESLKIHKNGIYVDCTVGGAGHSHEILSISSPGGRLIGLDRDIEAIKAASLRLSEFGDRVTLVQSNFVELPEILDGLGIKKVDGILYDLGVSSYQLDNPDRGFSYMYDAPLDMRMNRDSGATAVDLVNSTPEEELNKIIRRYGEERFAGKIASSIVREREKAPILTTGRLTDIIKQAIPAKFRREGPHPAKRTFQAIRIAVNDELGILEGALRGMVAHLITGGRACVITFHSLEDRIVKETFREMARSCVCPRDFPACVCGKKPMVKLINAGGIKPSAKETDENPRARSARLRIVEKLP
ncbi:MAG: 16S rRNA (cytosine(1402)-N(4))-methyltransferase RsmH [Firmicutes bacterium]|nr:16S rRNA (cytosine(1402)-N(4))-methyltransferase RsmH [Bacillota bacterium]